METKKDFSNHFTCIDDSIKWVNKNLLGNKKETCYSKLVDQRRELKKISYALSYNPAAAIYGESQKGKSYLVSSLLSLPNESFYVVDGEGNNFDFKLDINPFGQDKESTSVVTRFSSNYNWINKDFPVKIELLSVVDIILLLSDSYYNDLKNHNLITDDELVERIKLINKENYSNTIQQILGEDDILDIRDYFTKHFVSKSKNILSSEYFELISRKIGQISIEFWPDIFSILWNNNLLFVNLFKKLLNKYKELEFVDHLYVPFEAVLRKYGTLLDVSRLIELNSSIIGHEADYKSETSVFYINKNGDKQIKTIKKSFLCALTAEIIFKLPEHVKKEKDFLNNTDLLDFPGARARLENNENEINEDEVPKMLLRGKVAYLFNKYADNYKINTLLFCHDRIQASQRYMPSLLKGWIESTIGKTKEERQTFVEQSKIAPLFIISTKFNLDLQLTQNDSVNSVDSLNNRWSQRFSKILKEELINSDIYDWFNNWTIDDKNFNNIYLLRDYYYSSDRQNQLFRGFEENGIETEEIIHSNYPAFRKDLKNSFLNNNFVLDHFTNPELFWDEATAINKDGTSLIINNLTIATGNINTARESKFNERLNQLAKNLKNELEKHYHSNDLDNLLLNAKEISGRLQAKLDISYGRDPYFFAEMLKSFLLTESEIYNHYRSIINSLDSKLEIKLNEYATIRMRVPEINSEASFNDNLSLLAKAYEFKDIKDCEKYFRSENINLEELFFGQTNKLKLFSVQLAEGLKSYWLEQSRKNIKNSLRPNLGLNETDFEEILSMFDLLYNKLNLNEKIAKSLEKYVDRFDDVEDVQEMISDISAEIINSFINSVGFTYYSKEDIVEFETANKQNNLGLNLDFEEFNFKNFNKEEIGVLFENIDSLPNILNSPDALTNSDVLKTIPSFSNYKRWNELLKFGFIAVCDIPNYDVKANELLSEIKSSCSELKY
jgi:hypothetical protein